MEAILDIYKRVYNPLNPVACFDESSKQQIQDLVDALPVRPGVPAKFDSEYQRNGVGNLFMIFEPLKGQRHVKVTDRRTKMDWAECMKFLNRRIPTQDKLIQEVKAWSICPTAEF